MKPKKGWKQQIVTSHLELEGEVEKKMHRSERMEKGHNAEVRKEGDGGANLCHYSYDDIWVNVTLQSIKNAT